MPIFDYLARDLEGKAHKGEIETGNVSQASTLLRRKKLIVISIKNARGKESVFDKYFNGVSFADVAVMTRQLATMIQSGLVLSEALDILVEQQTKKRFKIILNEISDNIKGGLDFASALEKYPDVFPPLYSRLVRAGQVSGKLDVLLLQLADTLEKERDFQSKVKGAMIYPIVIVVMMFVVLLIMVFFVMPKLLVLYKDSGIDLPLPTKIVITFTDFMLAYWWLVLILVVSGVLLFRRFIANPEGRLIVDRLIINTPILGKITNLVILTSFTRTFSLLVSSGLSILESIKIVSAISGNMVYRQSFEIAYKGVERGLPFSAQLLSLPVFPKIVGQMVKTGEETGKLDEIVGRLATYFETESENNLKNITTLIEPIILVILGLGVGFLVISIILPIYQLTANIK